MNKERREITSAQDQGSNHGRRQDVNKEGSIPGSILGLSIQEHCHASKKLQYQANSSLMTDIADTWVQSLRWIATPQGMHVQYAYASLVHPWLTLMRQCHRGTCPWHWKGGKREGLRLVL